MDQEDKHSVIYELVSKKLTNQLSADDHALLESLVQSSEENKKIAEDVEKIWVAADSNLLEVDTDAAWNQVTSKIADESGAEGRVVPIEVAAGKEYRYMGIAAAIALLMGIFILYRFGGTPKMVELTAQTTQQVILPDGSKVDVKAGSTIMYPEHFDRVQQREMQLTGTAFFDVTKNPDKPFVIHTDQLDVKVLGTSFYIEQLPEGDIEVHVKSGVVKVMDAADTANHKVLKANENVRFKAPSKSWEQLEDTENKAFWKTKTLVFRRTPLSQVVEILSSSYHQSIVLGDEAISSCKLTATFKDDSLDEVLEVIKTTFLITVDKKDQKWVLRGSGCE